MIEVELPDGTVVEFPDGTAPDVMKGALQKRFGAPQPQGEQPSALMDSAKSFGTGIAQGAIGMAGAFGDTADLASRALKGGAEYLGAPEWLSNAAGSVGKMTMGPLANAPTSEQLQGSVEGVTGEFYKPQTTAGEYANTVGQFVPGAVMGPGGAVRKTAMAVVPGIASEAAGQATEGTAAEPYARIAGALGGGIATAGRSNTGTRQMVKNAPKMEAVTRQKNALYKSLENAGVKYDANAYGQWATDLGKKLQGLDPTLHPNASAVMKQIVREVGNSPDFVKMETLRKIAGETARGGQGISPADMNRANVILKEIDRFFMGAPLISNGSIPAGSVDRVAKQARELARRTIIGRDIQEMDRKSQFYVSGDESGKRNQFASYMKSQRGKGLKPAEEKAFNKVIRREGVENVLHNTGSRLAQIGTMAAGVGSIPATGAVGPLISGAAILGNMGARKVMEKVTDKRVKDALATVLAGGKAQASAMSADKKARLERIVRALLAEESGRNSAFDSPRTSLGVAR